MLRKVHRQCSVKGCRNTTSYNYSRSREIGNSVIMCERCAREFVGQLDALDAKTAEDSPTVKTVKSKAKKET